MKKVYLFLIIPVLSLCLFGCENKELKEKYDHGVKLIENKEWERATTVFKDLGDYKDSKDKLNEIIFLSSTETIDEHIDYPGLYGDDIKKGIKNLLSILKYKNTIFYLMKDRKWFLRFSIHQSKSIKLYVSLNQY